MELQRPPKSATQIEALKQFGPTELAQDVQINGTELLPETLVFLLRDTHQARNTGLFELCGRFLIGIAGEDGGFCGGYVEGIIRSVASTRVFLRDPDTLEEFRAECHLTLWRAIVAGTDKKPHLEERFGHALKFMCIDVARSLWRRHQRLATAETIEQAEQVADGAVPIDEAVLQQLAREVLIDALYNLPERQRQAVFLAWVEGYPITSPENDSVSGVMGISETAVHKHLRKARERLAGDSTVKKLFGRD